jgi:hypothetical protein
LYYGNGRFWGLQRREGQEMSYAAYHRIFRGNGMD